MEQSFAERRQFERISMLAYGQGKSCLLEAAGKSFRAELIDISAGGARLRLSGELPQGAKDIVFSVVNAKDNGLLQKLPSMVRWQNGLEIGVQFARNLEVAVAALQRMIC